MAMPKYLKENKIHQVHYEFAKFLQEKYSDIASVIELEQELCTGVRAIDGRRIEKGLKRETADGEIEKISVEQEFQRIMEDEEESKFLTNLDKTRLILLYMMWKGGLPETTVINLAVMCSLDSKHIEILLQYRVVFLNVVFWG